jgi:hypothetical protein
VKTILARAADFCFHGRFARFNRGNHNAPIEFLTAAKQSSNAIHNAQAIRGTPLCRKALNNLPHFRQHSLYTTKSSMIDYS